MRLTDFQKIFGPDNFPTVLYLKKKLWAGEFCDIARFPKKVWGRKFCEFSYRVCLLRIILVENANLEGLSSYFFHIRAIFSRVSQRVNTTYWKILQLFILFYFGNHTFFTYNDSLKPRTTKHADIFFNDKNNLVFCSLLL